MNRVELIGRVTKNIELRVTQTGKSVATFTLAVNNRMKEDGADFPVCVAWGKVADLINTYVKKGNLIGVSGKLSTRTYESKGQKHYVTEVIVDEVDFLEKKSKSVFEDPKPEQPDFAVVEDTEDLPF